METQASAITFLSTPGQGYMGGLGFVQIYFGLPIALIIIAAVFLPIFRRLNIYTAYELLGRRFDTKTRLLGAVLFLLQRGLGRKRASAPGDFDVDPQRPLKIGITCYPSIGGSGILASALGEELARRGHEIHFISYERPFRIPPNTPRLFFHKVAVNDYGLFKYPDYTSPLSVKMTEVSCDYQIDVLHVHYAVPHAAAAILALSMLSHRRRPRVITTLHGTDTTLLSADRGYGPAIHYALTRSAAVTVVSEFLKHETQKVLGI
jgi:Glycosyltransferase Family 4/Sodium:solute symporter family